MNTLPPRPGREKGFDDKDIVVKLQRGVTIRGKVMAGEKPVKRFRVDTRSREIPKDKDGNAVASDARSDRESWRRRGRGATTPTGPA